MTERAPLELRPSDDYGHGAVPSWFARALAVPVESNHVTVDGARIHFVTWGRSDGPGLLFVHGSAAHVHWWDHIAPLFADTHRVTALDLSGHGESDHRSRYSLESWATELAAVIDRSGIGDSPVVIGHSMGGLVGAVLAARHGDELAGLIMCDAPVTEPDHELRNVDIPRIGPDRSYATLEDSLSRFRTVPVQDHYLDFVLGHVARHSVREVAGRWELKFDKRIYEFVPDIRASALRHLPRVDCRVALICSEEGMVTPDIGAFMYEALGQRAPVIELPETGHHSMLDQPLLLITALRTLLADWRHSAPMAHAVETT